MSTPLIDRVTGTVVHLARIPLGLAAYGVGLVRGAAAAAIHAAAGSGGPARAEWVAPPEPLTEEAVDQPSEPASVVEPREFPPAAPQRPPAAPGEAFATEPSAVSRDSAHGGPGADADIDDWYGEAFLGDDPTPEGVVAALELGDRFAEPVDEQALLSEAETLRRAAARPGEGG